MAWSNQLRLLTDDQMRTFITQGFLILRTDFSEDFHRELKAQLDFVFNEEGNPGNNLLPRVRELQKVFESPVIRGALTSVLGPNYLLHTHRYGHLNRVDTPGGWHKDSYWGNERIRNHHPWWAMVMYFPQGTPVELGPTGVMPGTQFHESRTFIGDEHDWEGKAAGPEGTFALIHYDIWHRSNANKTGQNRYMLKFEFMRTQAPTEPTWNCTDSKWLTPQDLPEQMVRHELLWEENWNWLHGRIGSLAEGQDKDRQDDAQAIGEFTMALEDELEPVRLNAAYRLAAKGAAGLEVLGTALGHEDKDISKAAAYGLSVSGADAAGVLAHALASDVEYVLAHAAFALGELRHMASKVIPTMTLLTKHESAFVRRTVVEALGLIPAGEHDLLIAALSDAMQDADLQVRFWAGLALARQGPRAAAAIPNLIEALDDENRYVRGHSIEALRYIGTPQAMAFVIQYLTAARWCPITTINNEWYP